MRDDGRTLFLFPQAAPCSYRCKHCDFAASASFDAVPLNRLIEMVRPFVEARDRRDAPYKNLAVHLGDCPLNHPELSGWVAFLRQHNIEGWYSIAADGFRAPQFWDWRPYLEALRQARTEFLEFTLYGKGRTHDAFAARKGSYTAIRAVADLWREVGGKTIWFVFAHKDNLAELDEIRAEIAEAYQTDCAVHLWSYLGRGASIEELRLEAEDLRRASQSIQEQLAAFLPECEWVEQFRTGEEPPFPPNPAVIRATIDPAGRARIPYTPGPRGHQGVACGEMPVASVAEFIAAWHREYDSWRTHYPMVGQLCQKYGDAHGERLYDAQSVVLKWCDAYDAEP